MLAFLFDRRSLTLTLAVLGGIGLLLFLAGFLLGSNLRWEREGLPQLSGLAADVPLPSGVTAAPPTLPAVPGAASGSSDRSTAGPTDPAPPTSRNTVQTASWEAPESAADRADEPAPPGVWVPFSKDGDGPVASPAVADRGAPEESTSTVSPAASNPYFYVQVGAYRVRDNALEEKADLEARCGGKSYSPFLETVRDHRGRRLLTVRLGPFPTRDAAEAVAADFDDVLVGWSPGSGAG